MALKYAYINVNYLHPYFFNDNAKYCKHKVDRKITRVL